LCSAPATVTFTVTCVNDAPVAVNDTVTTPSETPIVIPVGSNDSDVDSALNPCSIDLDPNSAGQQTSFTVAGEGTYTLNASCQVVFTPVGSILGFTSCITYTISDVEGLASNAATICVTVGACVDNPTLDCDGDGVNNATEQTDGTDPLDPCSFNLAHATVAPSAEWLASDCDGDGVTNGQEIADGTNPLVGCDAVEEHVTVAQSAAFLNGDCDGDGLTNGVEIGPDPTHPSDIDNDGTPDYLEPNAGNPSAEDGIEIFNAVTPNGDGDNDVLVIRGIENYPNNTLEVYNRWGVKVYDTTGYGSNGNYFEGISYGRETIQQASELPTGTYYYVLKYVNASGITKERAGYLYINR
jgi:gliding motility-associated-like protein